jgi:outer membrane lipoprotein-sorting protein
MKTYFSLALLSVCVAGTLMAQTNDARAKAQLDKAVALLQQGATQCTFSISYSDEQTNTLSVQNGTIKLFNEKFYLQTGDISTWFDGKTQWVYMEKLNEVTISEPTAEELQEINPLILVKNYAKTHRVGFDSDTSDDGLHHISLYPLNNGADYFRIQFAIVQKTYAFREIRISHRSGERVSIRLEAYRKIPSPTNEMFSFPASKYPRTSINDLR